LGFRHRSEPILRAHDPRGRPVYWVGPAGRGQDAGPGTDFDAVAEGFVSVTPLQIDLTRHAALPALNSWLAGIDD
jgi:5'-nucleotidase